MTTIVTAMMMFVMWFVVRRLRILNQSFRMMQ
jgi:hypothetical protein